LKGCINPENQEKQKGVNNNLFFLNKPKWNYITTNIAVPIAQGVPRRPLKNTQSQAVSNRKTKSS